MFPAVLFLKESLTMIEVEQQDKLRHFAVCFEGVLKVTDEDLFTETVENGIGSAKGFGFGLLSLAPIKELINAYFT